MIEEFKSIIDKKILENYQQALIIDVDGDSVYKYINNDGSFELEKQSSYVEYITNCQNFIFEDDVRDYVSSLSISKLEENNSRIDLTYKMLDNKLGAYLSYINNISLYNENGKKIIVVLVSLADDTVKYEKSESGKSLIEEKYNKMVDSISMAMLKIHNIVNMDNNLRTKDEYINSVLVGLTTDYPELNKSFNENATQIYKSGKASIMIVDDDKMTCNLISKIFEKNYNIIIASNGQEAIEKIKQNKSNGVNVSCIFLDLIMPVMDGFGVLEYLNDNNYFNKLPVIIISGNYDKETRNKAYSYQIADMLEKPFNAQVIRHRIENLISLYRSSGILSDMMLEQQGNLKDIINTVINSYKIDNLQNMNMIRKYMKILTMQVSVQYPELNINSNSIDKIAESATYFSIGNYIMPKSLLAKRSAYTEEEKNILKNSSVVGSSMVKYVISLDNNLIDSKYCYEITRYYNERYDGMGYPEGLSGEAIPLAAQIASLVIEYMMLLNTVVPVDYDRISSLIEMESGKKFNPKIVEAFKRVRTEFDAITKVGG